MKPRSNVYNPKRRILPAGNCDAERTQDLAHRAAYTGNPEHKMHPGDYGLTPPCTPRPGKTLCDAEGELLKPMAETLLKEGIKRGMISARERDGFPQNIWAVSSSGRAFEAQLENQSKAQYHGYPMPEDDDFRDTVIEEWSRRDG